MSLLPLVGQEDLQARLRRAAEMGRLPQSLLFRGPPGIGKQRLALWLAGLVLCEASGDRPCGRCTSCRLAGDLQHPDIHWFFPLPSPKGAAGDRRRQKLEDARLEEIQSRRESGRWTTTQEGTSSIFLPIVREIRARAARRPAMGRSVVFVIGDADRLVPQASSPEAANALLKLLEEPSPDMLIFLTSSRAGALLPTIRSRVLEVRVIPPAQALAARFLSEHAGIATEDAAVAVRQADGAIGVALARLEEESADPRAEADRLLTCAVRGSRADGLRLAAAYPASGARGAFASMLEALGGAVRDAAAVAAGAPEAALDAGAAAGMPELASVAPEAFVTAALAVERARDAAAGNGNPEGIAAVLLADLARVLREANVAVL